MHAPEPESTKLLRYERKFEVDRLDVYQVHALVKRHPALFRRPYPQRQVNNIYLDTEDLAHYAANVSGIGDRVKIRIRWYGNLFGPVQRPALEFKVRRGSAGLKISYPFAPFVLNEHLTCAGFQQIVQQSNLPAQVQAQLRHLRPVLLNKYRRAYYATRDGTYRLTIDDQMAFYHLCALHNPFLHRHVPWQDIVVELKYGMEHERGAHRIAVGLPFTLSRHSKYVRGIEMACLPFATQ